jgi:hypothetical protein
VAPSAGAAAATTPPLARAAQPCRPVGQPPITGLIRVITMPILPITTPIPVITMVRSW